MIDRLAWFSGGLVELLISYTYTQLVSCCGMILHTSYEHFLHFVFVKESNTTCRSSWINAVWWCSLQWKEEGGATKTTWSKAANRIEQYNTAVLMDVVFSCYASWIVATLLVWNTCNSCRKLTTGWAGWPPWSLQKDAWSCAATSRPCFFSEKTVDFLSFSQLLVLQQQQQSTNTSKALNGSVAKNRCSGNKYCTFVTKGMLLSTHTIPDQSDLWCLCLI